LKSKEFRKHHGWARRLRHFDLRQWLNYLKVKTTGRDLGWRGAGDAGVDAMGTPSRCDCMILDSETKAVELPEDHGNEIRLWLRLLTCTTLIEGEVRGRLRERFDVTLPRFDLMAQLDKVPEGMTLSDVSKRMMVSNGNVTGLVERLVESGHLDRRTSDTDRRVQVIRLTKIGRAEFRKMAAEHESWIADLFGDLGPKDVRELMRLLAKTKASAQKSAQARAL
jgi:DNA-binding MarR family transcriptional regulator